MLKYDCKKSIHLAWKAAKLGNDTAPFGKQLKFAEDILNLFIPIILRYSSSPSCGIYSYFLFIWFLFLFFS